mgnify:FL=1
MLFRSAGSIKSKALALLGAGGMYGMIAQFLITGFEMTYREIMDSIESLFRAGGKFDVRKMVLDNVKTFSNLDHLIKINSGQVYFTSDTSEILRQGVYGGYTVNTRTALNGHRNANRLSI